VAFNELDLQRIKKYVGGLCNKRSPAHIRDQLHLDYIVEGQSVVIFEVRPNWRDPGIIMETEVAKVTFVRSQKVWKLYWMRADLKWHSYQPFASSPDLQGLVAEIDADPNGCFFG